MSSTQKSSISSTKRLLATAASAAMIFALLPASLAAANTDDVCPPPASEGGAETFPDVNTGVHADNIECLAGYDIAQGYPDGEYKPERDITRAQMATFIANFIETALGTTLDEGADAFTDDESSVHESNINKLANADVVSGRTATTYGPSLPVQRAAMATFVANALDYIDDLDADNNSYPPASTTDHFTDDNGNTHEGNINRLADEGIVQGQDSATEYNPGNNVFRGQMATFIMESAEEAHDDLGKWEPITGTPAAPTTVLGVPELVSAEVGESRTTGTQLVLFTFDEDITTTALNASLFHIYGWDGVAANGSAAQMQSGSTTTVEVQFTSTQVADATVATVDRGAVQDGDGNLNAIGSDGLQGVSFSTGETEAPDLTAATGPTDPGGSIDGDGDEIVAFDFDETVSATILNAAGFRVVYQDGTVDTSTGATRDTADTSVVNAVFNITSAEAAQVARACVLAGSVQDAENKANEQQCADMANSGNTSDPDLVSASKNTTNQTVQLVFTEAIQTYTNLTDFQIYDVQGNEASPSDITVSGNQVTLIFQGGTSPVQDDVTGVSIDQGAVTDANDNTASEIDEVGIPGTYTVAAGSTIGPDLVEVTAVATKNAFGTITGYTVEYKFDEAVTTTITCGNFFLWEEDNDRRTATACNRKATDTTVVQVTSFTKAQVEDAALGTVDNGAVRDADGNQNPEGDDPFSA